MRRVSTTTEEMKSYIAEAFVSLMERYDFSSITVQQIVTKAGVHRSTYYRHFESKEDVIRYYFHKVISEYVLTCQSPTLTFQKFLIGFFNHFLQYKPQMLAIHKNGMSYLLEDVYSHLLIGNVEKNRTIADQYRTQFQIGGTATLLIFWFARGMNDTAEDMARYIQKLLPSDYDSYLMPKNK